MYMEATTNQGATEMTTTFTPGKAETYHRLIVRYNVAKLRQNWRLAERAQA